MQVEIRPLQEGDIEALAAIEAETFSMPWSADAFRTLLTNPYCVYLVALDGDRIVGGAGYTDLCGEANIDNVVVAKSHQGQGIGQALVRELIALGEAGNITAFTLEVRVSNMVAIHIYEKAGFRSEGIRPGFYERPREDAMIMWKRECPESRIL